MKVIEGAVPRFSSETITGSLICAAFRSPHPSTTILNQSSLQSTPPAPVPVRLVMVITENPGVDELPGPLISHTRVPDGGTLGTVTWKIVSPWLNVKVN